LNEHFVNDNLKFVRRDLFPRTVEGCFLRRFVERFVEIFKIQ